MCLAGGSGDDIDIESFFNLFGIRVFQAESADVDAGKIVVSRCDLLHGYSSELSGFGEAEYGVEGTVILIRLIFLNGDHDGFHSAGLVIACVMGQNLCIIPLEGDGPRVSEVSAV